jgi:HEAT repeat protein
MYSMQASPVISNADAMLRLVWQGSLVLAALALLIAFGLAFKRWTEERARQRKLVRRAEISRLVQALIASPLELDARTVPALASGFEGGLFSVALDVLRVTRGRDADRMLELLEVWNLRPYLDKLLRGNRRSRQIRALTLLARFRDPESMDLLLQYLEDPAIYVQLAALRGIADRGAERGEALNLPLVVRALSQSRETNVPMLADILRRFGEPGVESIAKLAQSAKAVPGVRSAAVSALGSIGSLKAFDALQTLSHDASPMLRTRALESLTKLGDPRATPVVLHGLEDSEARVRAAAARAAGLLGLREALAPLADVLNDVAWEVRYRAAEALYLLGAPGNAVLRVAALGEGPAAEMAFELLAEKEGLPA